MGLQAAALSFSASSACPSVPLAAYKWLVCFLLEQSDRRLQQQRSLTTDEFEARNNSQVTSVLLCRCVLVDPYTNTQIYQDINVQYCI